MISLPDGPAPRSRCGMCGEFRLTDIYRYRGRILCGDCRFFVRHGRWPNYDVCPGGNTRAAGDIIEIQDARYHGYVV